MRILVTGGAGYIGSHTVRKLHAAGYEFCIYDNLSTGHRGAVPASQLIVGDLSDTGGLLQVLREQRITAIVHFAASAYVGESVREPAKYYQNNLVNTLNLMECMRQVGIDKMVFSSTTATYGIAERLPLTEDSVQQPISPYGFGKLAVETALRDYALAYGWGFVALRYFNAAGAHPEGEIGEDHYPETHLIPLAIQAAMGQRPSIEIFGTDYPTADGTCIRDYVHVEDLAAAHVLALEQLVLGKGKFFNLGSGRGYSVRQVIQMVEEVSGKPVPVLERPRRPGDAPALIASAERASRELGWQPRYGDLRTIVQSAWNWHRLHPHGFADGAAKTSSPQ